MTKKEISPRRLCKLHDAALYLAVSDQTLWQMTKDGQIPCVRLRRSVRYDIADLDAFISRAKGVSA